MIIQGIKKSKMKGIIGKVFEKSSLVPEKMQGKNTKKARLGILSCFRSSGRRCFDLGRGSDVSGIFWSK